MPSGKELFEKTFNSPGPRELVVHILIKLQLFLRQIEFFLFDFGVFLLDLEFFCTQIALTGILFLVLLDVIPVCSILLSAATEFEQLS
jgi:hypothetical protein